MNAPPPDLMQLLTRAERLMARRVTAILDGQGCSLDGWRVLTLLSDGTGRYMTDIAEQVFLPPATLTKLVDHLVDDNLVYRRVDDVDRRRIRAYLTPRGHTLHQRIRADIRTSMAGLNTTGSDRELLEELLTRLVTALTAPPVKHPHPAGC
jgi:DNA-binding MarR family transcriptional regulator